MKPTDESARAFGAQLIMSTVLEDTDKKDPMRYNLMRVAFFLRPMKSASTDAFRSLLKKIIPADAFAELEEQFEESQRAASLKDLEIGETFFRLKLHHLESEVAMAQRALEIVKSAVRAAERASNPESVK